MIKKSLMILSISATYFAFAQDVSTIKNTVEVYSNSGLNGTSKYNSMAGSMGALGGDYSVINTNPAGIGVSIASDFSGTLSIESNKSTSTLFGKSMEYKINSTDLGNLGGVAAFQVDSASPWKFVNIAFNYSNLTIENYTETPGNHNLSYPIYGANNSLITDLYYDGHAYNRYGNLNKMSVAIGANYDHRIYLGAGLNFHGVTLEQYDSAKFISSSNNVTETFNKQYTPFSESSSGFSASVGFIGKFNPQFRVGAAIETPTWWNISRVYTEYENPTDGTYNEDRKLSTPLKATLSAAYVPSKNLAINVDYTLGLTKPNYKVYGGAETELNNFFDKNHKNLSEVKIGAEYRIEQFRLRGGYAFASSPFDLMKINSIDANSNVGNNSFNNVFVGKRSTIGAGLGYDFKSFFIDAAYQNVSSENSNPFIQGSAANNTGYFSNNYIVESDASLVSNVKGKKDNFFITLGWKF